MPFPSCFVCVFLLTKLLCSCHIWGDHDVLKYKSQELTKSCEDPLVMVHASGHKVPNTKTIDVDKLRAFIATKTT